jgi:type I restriction enzyme, R subunit
MIFNEDSRVKIPAIVHLTRLGYTYLPLKNATIDKSTNIFLDIFKKKVAELNPELSPNEVDRFYEEVSICLENEDLGRVFFEKLIDRSGRRLIDFDNFSNNDFHVVTELTYQKDDEEFRPDLTILINGMPLFFIEVKKPNNLEGIQAEVKRMTTRFTNKKFKKFANITQLMVFSNNMEYDDEAISPIQGAFYATPAYGKMHFNYFREEEKAFELHVHVKPIDKEKELVILRDNNVVGIKDSPEYQTNLLATSPTHRLLSSLFEKSRVEFLLKYAIAYVKEEKGLEKHIMRYPQLFATKALERKLNEGIRKGIIWHTQGSGKTALAYYNVKFLTEYFQQKTIVAKFYFIVDRLDLLIQAAREFKARGLVVHEIDSREDFAKDIKSTAAIHNNSGKAEITVVNIQKFKDDPDVTRKSDYQLSIQRVFFLDEVHRSYNPKGSFLANLKEADPDSIKIGLTGTPLLGSDYNSRALFGDYIHKYYYNASIKDGYTLRLIREEISTQYKAQFQKILDEIKVLKGSSQKKHLFAHRKFVVPMLEYIVDDFERSRERMDDPSIGGMVVCSSSEQAKLLYEVFQEIYAKDNPTEFALAADSQQRIPINKRKQDCQVKSAALILHDVSTKQERKDQVEAFKEGKIDFLFVYNMLLTGFDAKRLKKLYVGRKVKSHNLLQMLTRVNRTYKEFRYGYVVDFVNIKDEFDAANKAYFAELQSELGDEMIHYSNLFKSAEEITLEIEEIKEVLFPFDTMNMETFSKQISQINDRKEIQEIVKVLQNAKVLYNLIRLQGNYDLLEKVDFQKLNKLGSEAERRLSIIAQKEVLESDLDSTNLLNIALEEVFFAFTKVKEEEMILADALKNTLQKTREMLGGNFDPKDPEFISLKEQLELLFKKQKLTEVTAEDMSANMKQLESIYQKAKKLEYENQLIRAKYANDAKFARLHKRLMEKDPLTEKDSKLFEALNDLKLAIDEELEKSSRLLEQENYSKQKINRLVIEQLLTKHQLPITAEKAKSLGNLVFSEYLNEYQGRVA